MRNGSWTGAAGRSYRGRVDPTRQAAAQARAAQAAGAAGVLLLPPYLTEAGQRGLAEPTALVGRVA
jgi:hypothetical protein